MGHLLKVECRRGPVRDLHGVAATQAGRVGTLLAFEPLVTMALAAGAIDLAEQWRDLDLALHVFPHVEVEQVAVDCLAVAAENFNASVAWKLAMMLTIGPSTPAVSQVPASPGAGAASKTQRRHGVSPGKIVIVCP